MAINADHKDVNYAALKHHNKLRALHHSQNLEIDWKLAKSAQAYAEKLAKNNSFEHSDSKGEYGENLASSFNSSDGYVFSGEAATQNWYDEIKDYKFGQETQQNNKIGHFSQVVWKDTKFAGFGRAKSTNGTYIIVGQYTPPGNFIGRFKENVLSASGPAPSLKKDEPRSNNNPPPSPKTVRCCGFIKKSSKNESHAMAHSDRIKPVIGPKSKTDQMIKSNTKTTTINGKKVVEVTETYQTKDGKTYDRSKKTESKA